MYPWLSSKTWVLWCFPWIGICANNLTNLCASYSEQNVHWPSPSDAFPFGQKLWNCWNMQKCSIWKLIRTHIPIQLKGFACAVECFFENWVWSCNMHALHCQVGEIWLIIITNIVFPVSLLLSSTSSSFSLSSSPLSSTSSSSSLLSWRRQWWLMSWRQITVPNFSPLDISQPHQSENHHHRHHHHHHCLSYHHFNMAPWLQNVNSAAIIRIWSLGQIESWRVLRLHQHSAYSLLCSWYKYLLVFLLKNLDSGQVECWRVLIGLHQLAEVAQASSQLSASAIVETHSPVMQLLHSQDLSVSTTLKWTVSFGFI